MDSEFVNVYINKTKGMLDDTIAKLLLCETSLSITEQRYKTLLEMEQAYILKIQELEKEVANLKVKKSKRTEDNSTF